MTCDDTSGLLNMQTDQGSVPRKLRNGLTITPDEHYPVSRSVQTFGH